MIENTVWDGQWARTLILGYEVISTLQVESFRIWHMGLWNISILVSIYVSVVSCDLVTLFKSQVMTLNLDYVYSYVYCLLVRFRKIIFSYCEMWTIA